MKPFTKNLQQSIWFNKEVLNLQTFLEKQGFGDFVPTGIFGPKTKQAITKFQRYYGITPALGNFGSKTRMMINKMLFTPSEIIYHTALSVIGIDASPQDKADDSVGCAETVNAIVEMALGQQIGGGLSTYSMYNVIKANPNVFEEVSQSEAERGVIIISPTGTGNGNLSNGHVGILGDKGKIMSNSSSNGKWMQNYDVTTWRARYVGKGGMLMKFYRIKKLN